MESFKISFFHNICLSVRIVFLASFLSLFFLLLLFFCCCLVIVVTFVGCLHQSTQVALLVLSNLANIDQWYGLTNNKILMSLFVHSLYPMSFLLSIMTNNCRHDIILHTTSLSHIVFGVFFFNTFNDLHFCFLFSSFLVCC